VVDVGSGRGGRGREGRGGPGRGRREGLGKSFQVRDDDGAAVVTALGKGRKAHL
jgi:hypothetical protein